MTEPKSVLIVEDDADLADVVADVLTACGYRVTWAADGIEGLARVEAGMPDIILLDMRMPRMNGQEFARELRAQHARTCPIVVVTAAENARHRAQEIRADGWIAKPFDLDDLVAVVERLLGEATDAASAPSG